MAGAKMSITKLWLFVKFLEDKIGFKFDIEKFEHRLMLQKYVFIAKFFGLNLGYPFSIYLRGPYSPALADDYYKLAEAHALYERGYKKAIEGVLNTDEFLKMIEGKDVEWLEVAATILSLYNRYHGKYSAANLEEVILSTTCDIKSFMPTTRILGVFNDLKRRGLFVA